MAATSVCKEALAERRVSSRKRVRAYQSARRAQIRALKMTLACVDCGWSPTTDQECGRLHFDHVDPHRKWSAGKTAASTSYWSWDRVLEEIALCVPRCSSCHGHRTNRQRRGLDA